MSNHDYTADVRVAKGDAPRATALPDANQSTVLPAYAVGTTSPNSRPGATVIPKHDGISGTMKTGQPEVKLAVGPQFGEVATEQMYIPS